jgi:hypothetical protein
MGNVMCFCGGRGRITQEEENSMYSAKGTHLTKLCIMILMSYAAYIY